MDTLEEVRLCSYLLSKYLCFVFTPYFSIEKNQMSCLIGRISRRDIISSPTPNDFIADPDIDGQCIGIHKKYEPTRKNKKSKACNIL